MALSIEKRRRIKELLDEGHAAPAVAEEVGCSVQAVYYYKKQQRDKGLEIKALAQQALSELPAVKVPAKMRSEDWENLIPQALEGGLRYLVDSLPKADEHDPRSIMAVTAAVDSLLELQLTLRVIRARFGDE